MKNVRKAFKAELKDLKKAVEILSFKFDGLVKSPKLRHACEGRHPEVSENTGFPLSRE